MNSENKDIWKDLKSSGPGFTTPKGYFGTMGDRFFKLIEDLDSQHEDLDRKVNNVQRPDHDNVLDQIKKDHGFRVPEGYFQKESVPRDNSVSTPVVNLRNRNLKILYMAVAASILLFFGIRYMGVVNSTEKQLLIQEEEIAGWIEEDLVTLSDSEIAEVFGDLEVEDPFASNEEIYSYLNYMDIENIMLEN